MSDDDLPLFRSLVEPEPRRTHTRPRRIVFQSYYDWPQDWDRTNPAFDGLSEELKDIICDEDVTMTMVRDLWDVLSNGEAHYVHVVIAALEQRSWFPPKLARSSKERLVRKIFDTGVARGYPFCSGNYGYCIGDSQELFAAGERQHRFARGAAAKAEAFTRLAKVVKLRGD
jgi:hypothetical protein